MAIGNTDLGITLGARVDTSQAQKDINAFTRNDGKNKARQIKLDVDVNTKEIADKLDHAIKMGYTNKVKDTMQKISTDITRNLTQTIKTIDGEKTIGGLTKVVERFKSDLGEIQERVTIFREGALKPVTHSLQTVKEGVKDVSTTTNTVVKDIDGVTTKVTTLEKVILDTNNEEHKIITTTKEWVDEQNRLHQEIKVTDENEKQLSATQKTVIDDTRKAAKAIKEMGEALNGINNAPKDHRTSKITYVDKSGVKTVKEMVDGIDTLITTTKEYTTAQGALVKETKVFNKITGETRTNVEVLRDRQQEELQKAKELEEQIKKEAQAHRELLNEKEKALNQLFEEKKQKEIQKSKELEAQTKKEAQAHREALNEKEKFLQQLNQEIQKKNELKQAQEKLNRALVSTTTQQTKGTSTKWGDTSGKEYASLITTIRQVDKDGKVAIKTIEEFTDSQGRLVQQTRVTDENLKKIAEDEQRISEKTQTVGQSLSDAMSRLAKYTIAMLPIQMLRKALSETITTIQEFDSALIEFRKVSDLAGESLTNYVAKLAKMGEITGSTMQAMVEASTEFRKSGFSDEDSAKLASIAEKYRNIADEEISAGESASFIIAQMKAFNIEAGQAEHIIDSVNEVANNFSVSSADLATNLGNMSAIMAINNVSMEQQIGMLTGVTEITRNASSASRGLVMVSSRLTQVLDESSSTGKKLTKIYEDLGIELKDQDGQLRSHYDILGDLAGQWDNLSENEQKYIALTSAGARQQQNFVALMENWNQVAKATATAYSSMGSAQKENEKVMDSISKKVEILKSQFQQLVIGKGSLQTAAKAILNLGIAFLKFANSDVGQVIIKLTLLAATFKALSLVMQTTLIANIKNLATTFVGLISYLMSVALTNGVVTTSFGAVIAAVHTLTYALIEMAAAWATTPMGMIAILIAGIATAVIAGNQALEKYNARLKDASDKLNELSEEAKSARDELEGLNSQLENIRKQIKDNSEKIKLVDPEEAEKLKEENEELEKQERNLERQIALQEQKLALAEKEAEEQAKITLKTTTQSYWKTGEIDDGTGTYAGTYKMEVVPEEELRLATNEYNRLEKQIRSLEEVQKNESNAGREQGEVFRNTAQKITELTAEQEKAKERGIEMSDIVLKGADNLKSADSATQEYKENLLGLVDNFQSATGYAKDFNDENKNTQEDVDETAEELSEEEVAILRLAEAHNVAAEDLKAWAKELGISEEALVGYADALGISVEKAYEFQSQLKSYNEQLDLIQSALGTLKGAVDEYNESQYLSLDTVQALLELDPEYLKCLEEENGQLVLNEEKITNKTKALIEEQKQTVYNIAMERLRSLEIGESSKAEEEHKGKVENNTDAINTETDALLDNAKAYALKIGIESNGKKKAEAEEIVADLEAQLNVIKKLGNSIDSLSSKSSRAGRSAKSAGKAATDAAKEAKKELEDLIKKYEKVIKYINKRYDREIKKIKDAKSEAVKAEEKKIKAVEKEKDHALDAIEKQIKALKKEQDARKQYWSDRIDALKKQNDALKDSLELQEKLDALEKARNTRIKIYKEGQGFVYDVDQTAVTKAQKELDEYLSQKAYEDELERLEALKDAELDNYEKRLDALNEYKDSVQENYEKQIEQMNEYKDQLSEQYDAQIDKWEEYKEQFGDLVDQYEEQQNKLLFEQLMGIKDENSNWLTRLDNLAEFVRKYNELQNKLNTGDTSVTNTAKMKEGTGSGTGSSNRTGGTKNTSGSKDRWGTTLDVANKATKQPKYDSRGFKLNYASGTPSIKDDQIAIVGENPNQEIVIGSKINNGELMNLGKGTGIVNADSSKTLAGMLNQVGQFGASGFGSGNGTLNNNINNDSLVINGVTVQGANIKDPETFVNGLLNLKAEALQRAYRHR